MSTASTTLPNAGPVAGSRSFLSRLREGDEIARMITFVFAASVVILTVLLVFELWNGSTLARHKFGLAFFVTRVWDPVFEQFGALPFIYGTVVTSVVALLTCGAVGNRRGHISRGTRARSRVRHAAVLHRFAGRGSQRDLRTARRLHRRAVDARVRSAGAQKYFGFLPLFQGPAYGLGFLTAGIVLAIMVIPYIISVSREVLLSVPRDQREAALALGSTRWESTWKVVVPFARTGIMGSIFLALARALGETMAVSMVIGNAPTISASLFSPGDSIASIIANQFSEATGELYTQSLIELGLVLFLLTFILNGLARILILATTQRGSEMGNA